MQAVGKKLVDYSANPEESLIVFTNFSGYIDSLSCFVQGGHRKSVKKTPISRNRLMTETTSSPSIKHQKAVEAWNKLKTKRASTAARAAAISKPAKHGKKSGL